MAIALVGALLRKKIDVMVPAPVLAEVSLQASAPIPLAGLNVVAFDRTAAEYMGEHFPQNVLIQSRDAAGSTTAVVRMDSMIVATALRHRAEVLYSYDLQRPMVGLCAQVGLPCVDPRTLAAPQQELFDE